jgi:hypothetical protein
MRYEYVKSNIFPHRVVLEPEVDDFAIFDLFSSVDGIVGMWLVEHSGSGSYYAGGGAWHAYWAERKAYSNPLFSKGPFHIGFRQEHDSTMFILRFS